MKRTATLQIGLGRTGNVLVDKLKSYNKLYNNVLFVNSSLADVSALDNYTDNNTFIFSGVDGSGRDKDKASGFVKDNLNALADTILRFGNIEHVFLWFSLDGGTGSTTSMFVAQLLKKLSPKKQIHVISVMPDVDKVDKVGLSNTIDTWNKMIDLHNAGVIQTIRCINNANRNSYNEINDEAIKTFDESFNLVGRGGNGDTIDTADQERVLNAKGYILTLNMEDSFNNVKANIENAMKKSVYLMPESFSCDYLAMNIQSGSYAQSVKDLFEVYESTYSTSNDRGEGRVVLSGCDIPSEAVMLVKYALDEKQNRLRNRSKNTGTKIELDAIKPLEKPVEKVKVIEEPINYSAKELDSLLEDISLDLF